MIFSFTLYKQTNSSNSFIYIYSLILIMYVNISKVYSQNEKINPNGYNIFYFENGIKSSEGELENGLPNKYWITYYKNGEIKSKGNRTNFKLDGNWFFYNENGILDKEINYKEDKKNGETKLYNDLGVISEVINYKNGMKNGLYKIYLPLDSGKISYLFSEVNYNENKKNGDAFEFDTSSCIITLLKYDNGFEIYNEKINRFDLDNKKHGTWKEFYDNGNIKLEIKYSHGKLNGRLKEFNKNGKIIYIEEFYNGEIAEKKQEIIFEFEKQINIDGTISIGVYKNNKKQGTFKKYSENEVLINYENYKNNIKLSSGMIDSLSFKQGPWTYFYKNGEIKATGYFTNDKKDSSWIYYFPNGEIQQKGFYSNALPTGHWIWWYENKQEHRVENFIKGKENGESVEYDTLGNIITKGQYNNGLKEGEWCYLLNDYTEKGSYVSGEKNGLWESKYKDGNTYFKGNFLVGFPDGKHIYYYSNDKIKEVGEYSNGNKDGDWNKYSFNGELILNIEYKNGIEYKIDGVKVKKIREKK